LFGSFVQEDGIEVFPRFPDREWIVSIGGFRMPMLECLVCSKKLDMAYKYSYKLCSNVCLCCCRALVDSVIAHSAKSAGSKPQSSIKACCRDSAISSSR
jgi:hypothetical protein